MTIPEPQEGFAAQKAVHAKARGVFDEWQAAGLDVDTLSMGMTGDLEAAVAAGSTMVRVGTAIFGGRINQSPPPLAQGSSRFPPPPGQGSRRSPPPLGEG